MFKEFVSKVVKISSTVKEKVSRFFKKEEKSVRETWTEAVNVLDAEIKRVKKSVKKSSKKVVKKAVKKVAKKVAKKVK